MRLFRRRAARDGRHALGAAVTAIPSAVPPVRPAPPCPRLPSRADLLATAPRPPAAPRVQLGFRDGSCADLDPSSAQSRALRELADALTRPR